MYLAYNNADLDAIHNAEPSDREQEHQHTTTTGAHDMTTYTHNTTPNVPTVTHNDRRLFVNRTSNGKRVIGYADLIDIEAMAAHVRGAIADAYLAGQAHARADVARIVDTCTDHDNDDAINGADLTDTLTEWLTP